MLSFASLRIFTRLASAFAAGMLRLIRIYALSIDKVGYINVNLTQMNNVNSVKQRNAINLRGSVHDRAIALRDAVLE